MTSPTSPTSPESPSAEDRSARIAVTVFPVLILAAFAVSLVAPAQLSPLSAWTSIALGIIMFGMGLTLTPPDFALVARRPLPVLVGVVAQFVIMPTLAWILAKVFGLDPALAAGVSAEVGTTTAAASASTDRARVKVGQDIRGLSRQIVGGGPSPLAEGADRGLPGAQTSRGRVPGDLP